MFASPTDTLSQGALDGLAARHRSLLNNIANAETPGFQPQDVPFEAQLSAMRDSLAQSGGSSTPAPLNLAETADPTAGSPAQGVRLDDQVLRLEENTLSYQALIQAARTREQILRDSITGGSN